MSEKDSGVDTCSDESTSMSVESPPRSDDDKEASDIVDKLTLFEPPSFSYWEMHRKRNYTNLWQLCVSKSEKTQSATKIRSRLNSRRNAVFGKSIYPRFASLFGERKLRIAASRNDLEEVRYLLDHGVNPSSQDERGRTPLHFAASHGHTAIAELLIDRGADVNQRDGIGNTPLHLAACTSHIEMVTLLLHKGTDVSSLDYSGRSPFHLALSKLKLLQMTSSFSSFDVKTEMIRILEMMQVYLLRQGKRVEMDFINNFSNRLQLHHSREEVDSDVKDLLTSISHLSLQKADH